MRECTAIATLGTLTELISTESQFGTWPHTLRPSYPSFLHYACAICACVSGFFILRRRPVIKSAISVSLTSACVEVFGRPERVAAKVSGLPFLALVSRLLLRCAQHSQRQMMSNLEARASSSSSDDSLQASNILSCRHTQHIDPSPQAVHPSRRQPTKYCSNS